MLAKQAFLLFFPHRASCGIFVSQSGIEPRPTALQVSSLPAELPGKPIYMYAAAAKSLQSCLTLCDPIDSSPPGSPVLGILQARTLEWVAISFSNA